MGCADDNAAKILHTLALDTARLADGRLDAAPLVVGRWRDVRRRCRACERIAAGEAEAGDDRVPLVHGALTAEWRRVDAEGLVVERPARDPADGVRSLEVLEEDEARGRERGEERG